MLDPTKALFLPQQLLSGKWQWVMMVLWQWCRILFSFNTPSLPRPLSLPHSTSNKPVWVIAGKTAPRCASPPDTKSPLANHSDAEESSWRKMHLTSIHSRVLLYRRIQLMRENPKVRSHELKKDFCLRYLFTQSWPLLEFNVVREEASINISGTSAHSWRVHSSAHLQNKDVAICCVFNLSRAQNARVKSLNSYQDLSV